MDCSGGTFFINNLPIGATVFWSSSDINIATVVNNNNQGIVSRVGSTSGNVRITGTITLPCGTTVIEFKDINIGRSNGNDFTISSIYNNNGCYVLFEILDLQSFPINSEVDYAVSYEWSYLLESSTQQTVWTTLPCNGSSCTASFYEEGNYQVRLITTDACGAQSVAIKYITISSSCSGGGFFSITASPNPTDGDLNVTIEEEKPEVKALSKNEKVKYVLYDLNRGQAVKQWVFENNQNQQRLNVRDIKPGQYILVITKGKYRQSKQIIIR